MRLVGLVVGVMVVGVMVQRPQRRVVQLHVGDDHHRLVGAVVGTPSCRLLPLLRRHQQTLQRHRQAERQVRGVRGAPLGRRRLARRHHQQVSPGHHGKGGLGDLRGRVRRRSGSAWAG